LHQHADMKIFQCIMVSIGWHCTIVIAYFLWYTWQRRYSNAHFLEGERPGGSQSISRSIFQNSFQNSFLDDHWVDNVAIRELEIDASTRSPSPLSPTAAGFAFTPQPLHRGPCTGPSNHGLRPCRMTSDTRAGDSFPGSQQSDLEDMRL
jgi:hypothetical protein